MEMTYFLTTGMPLPQLRMDEKKRLVVRSHNFCLEYCITRAAMESGDAGYVRIRGKLFCTKLTAVRQGVTMRGMLRPKKYGKPVYGGLPRKRTRTSIASSVIYVNDWVSPRRLRGCHTNPFYRWTHSRSEVLILSVLLHQQ